MGVRERFDPHFRRLVDLGFTGDRVTAANLKELGDSKGAYILIIRLDVETGANIKSLDNPVLPSGWYFYVGSANGGGGIKSRLARHLSDDKKLHWHIDHLTIRARTVEALAITGGNECEIADKLYQSGDFIFPVHGFGNSDCKVCKSHLLKSKK
jgi:Uri superfamily endonuclease